jgi:uncharacterized membrane protein YqjE
VATEESGSGRPAAAPGLLTSLRNLAANAVAILRTRLELLGTEVEEESLRLAQLAFWGLVAILFLTFSLIMLTLLVVVLFWDTHRVMVVALLAVGYLGAGLAVGFWVRSRLRSGSKLFSASLAELAKDHEQLTSRHVP